MKKLIFATLMLAIVALIPMVASAQGFDKGPDLDATKDYYALIKTNQGDIPLVLFADKTPLTVKNFVNLAEGTAEFKDSKTGETVKRPFYNGLIFHRVIPDFMIQGGCPLGIGSGNPGYKFKDEFVRGLKFIKAGQLAMANSGPNTNGSQFFITDKATSHLTYKHTIFGEIVPGTDGVNVVSKIARVPQGASNKPIEDVVMKEVKIFRYPVGTPQAAVIANMIKGKAIPPMRPDRAERPIEKPIEKIVPMVKKADVESESKVDEVKVKAEMEKAKAEKAVRAAKSAAAKKAEE